MTSKKRIIDIFQSKGLLFPETEKEIEQFELLNPIDDECPSDWDTPEEIIKRGIQKLNNINLEHTEDLDSEAEKLKMVARKGSVLPQHIIDRMKGNHKKDDK
ncbi:hypothetical protein [Chryseobacterium viscerum]|uniref:Uncharacterized protein n=1 Tax=Chryseobacterium viscerum TaxID=1037377 RepID=A0A316WAM2_9FLAO|nr:hypothetical protein [Chryseobacterium viscerum]PWN58432.1 hypothetical protein C1634_023050 [Chryseobacterium viscerum]